jgi:hypothetical protein
MRNLRAAIAAAVVVGAATLVIGCGSSGSTVGSAGTPASSGAPPSVASAAASPPAAAASPAPGMFAVAPGWQATAASDFVRTIDNPWFPLVRGRSWVSMGVKDGKPTVDTYTVTGQTKQIMGVTASVIRDRLTTHGRVIEATWDWYAQDKQGNVWYLGEDTKEYDAAGKVTSTAGSWQTGVDGASAGIYMPADPQVGMGGYQEYLAGQALDRYKVVGTNASITVPYGAFSGVLQTRETTALEPGNVDAKYYVKGIGQVAEETMKGPRETSLLSKLTK